MAVTRKLKLGFLLHGVGHTWDDWRHPGAEVDASTNFKFYVRQAQLAEKGKFDFLFVADELLVTAESQPHMLNRFEPLTILSALAALTSKIGLVATVTVSYSDPFNVARQFASLDHISGGRAGWNVVSSYLGDTAANFSKAKHPPHDVRYRLAAEYLDVVQGLWDSYEDDAFVADKESGVFLDPDKQHRLDHKGEFFQVRGPLNIKRSRQGQPVIFQAGNSNEGRNFAASRGEAIFGPPFTLGDAQNYYRDVKRRARGFGRNTSAPLLMPHISPVIGATEAEAEDKYQELVKYGSLETGLAWLNHTFNDHDFSVYDFDGPFPDVTALGLTSHLSASHPVLALVQAENLTMRQVVQQLSTPRSDFIGTPEQVAQAMQHWLESEGADGFVVSESLPGQFDIFVDQVIPILQARGLFRREYEGETLREHFGLPFPVNRYTTARQALSKQVAADFLPR